jgi:hypothetical protein
MRLFISGMPACGKSTFSRWLASEHDFIRCPSTEEPGDAFLAEIEWAMQHANDTVVDYGFPEGFSSPLRIRRAYAHSGPSTFRRVREFVPGGAMAVSPRVLAAAATLSAEFTAGNARLGRVAQVGGPPLTRLDCFVSRPWRAMAGQLDADDRLVQLWLATMIWGHARDNRGPGKVLTALNTSNNVVAILRHSIGLLDAGNFASAYVSCFPRGAGYLDGFGESFFTKWLWSAGLGSALLPLPLVFDDRVRAALVLLGPTWDLSGRNGAQRYVDYCCLAADVAYHLAAAVGHLDAEKVEYALYCL